MSTTTSEIDDYVTAAHAALADLSDADREDLLDDLPQHLADVQADAQGGALVDLIGTPEAYAAELRATAGLDGTPTARPWWPAVRAWFAEADQRLGAALNYDRFVDLLRALMPAWWLVRAYLLVQVATRARDRFGSHALVPQVDGSRVIGVAVLVLACAGSVWLGRRGFGHEWQRVVSVLIGIALLWFALTLVQRVDMTSTVYVDNGSDDGTAGISNIYPVGSDGTVLKGVRLYDQDGNPVALGEPACPDDGGGVGDQLYTRSVGGSAPSDGALLYPLTCPTDQGPFPSGHAPALAATPSPSPSNTAAAPSTTPAPAASSTPAPRVPATPTPTG